MSELNQSEVTRVLNEVKDPRKQGSILAGRLYEVVYDELRQIAGNHMRRERIDHTLQPTALVNEVYLKLVDQSLAGWDDRAHFFGIASRAMRQVLVDHARKHGAIKRGGDMKKVTLDENMGDFSAVDLEILAVEDALQKLAQEDERMARVVELRIFSGLLSREVAEVLGVSKRTVDSDWKVAKMWLARELAGRVD